MREDSEQQWTREDRVDGAHVTHSSGSGAPPGPEDRVIKVWQLLVAIFSIQAILLAAHYQFVMVSVKGLLQEHEINTVRQTTKDDDERAALKREIELLKTFDQQSLADRGQMRSDIERMERDLTLIQERQAQVRAKLGLVDGVNGTHR